jgi:rRNA biogenesis protein RRP5
VENKKVEMTFRSRDFTRETMPSINLADLHEGQKVDARVKKTEEYGLFLEIKGTKISGLCHKSEVSLAPS